MIHKCISSLFLMLFLASCTTNGLMFRSWGGYDSDPAVLTHEVYKIEAPYSVSGTTYTPRAYDVYEDVGIAGWYIPQKSELTANGARGDPNALTAMHKTLPLPSVVRITNLENKKSVVVTVNDRGPFVNNRLIDVSRRAAQELDFPFQESTLVRIELLPEESRELKEKLIAAGHVETALAESQKEQKTANIDEPLYQPDADFLTPVYNPDDPATYATEAKSEQLGNFYVQHGVFKNEQNARTLAEKLNEISPTSVQAETDFFKVRSGPYESREKADSILDKFKNQGYGDSMVIENASRL